MQATKAAASSVTSPFEQQLKIVSQLRDAMSDVASSLEKMGQTDNAFSADMIKELKNQLDKTKTSSNAVSKAVSATSDILRSKFTKSVIIAVTALDGLVQGFRNMYALTKSVTGFFGSVISGAFGVAKAIIAIPFKMMSGLFKMATQGGGSNELAQAIEDVRKQFGDLSVGTGKAVISVSRNMGAMNQTGVSTFRLFGNIAERTKAVNQFATELGNTIYTLDGGFEKHAATMMFYQKGLGLSGEQMKTITQAANAMGKQPEKVLNDMTKQALGMAKAFQLDAKVLS